MTKKSTKEPKVKAEKPTKEKVVKEKKQKVIQVEQPEPEGEFNDYAHEEFVNILQFAIDHVGSKFDEDTHFELLIALAGILTSLTQHIGMPKESMLEMLSDFYDETNDSEDLVEVTKSTESN